MQAVCLVGTRSDGAVRPTGPKKVLTSDAAHQDTPLRQWLGEWLHNAPRTTKGLPLITLWLEANAIHVSYSTMLVKGLRPREGRLVQYCM